jgi:hypothetical protein
MGEMILLMNKYRKRYRVLKEFFVYAKDEYEAETKAEDKKLDLPWNLIDVQEMKGEDEKV